MSVENPASCRIGPQAAQVRFWEVSQDSSRETPLTSGQAISVRCGR